MLQREAVFPIITQQQFTEVPDSNANRCLREISNFPFMFHLPVTCGKELRSIIYGLTVVGWDTNGTKVEVYEP